MHKVEDFIGFEKIEKTIKGIIELFESDYVCEKMINNSVTRYRKINGLISCEIIYKNIDVYFYENYFNLYVDNYCLEDEYVKYNDIIKIEDLPIIPTKGGFALKEIDYSNDNLNNLLIVISRVL